jgi:hypothetical protein
MSAASLYAIDLATQDELRSQGNYSVIMLMVYVLISLIFLSLSLQKRELDRSKLVTMESKLQPIVGRIAGGQSSNVV